MISFFRSCVLQHLKGGRLLSSSTVAAVSSECGRKRLNISNASKCFSRWCSEKVHLAFWRRQSSWQDGPARSGQINVITSKIKPDWRNRHTFQAYFLKEIFDQKKTWFNFSSRVSHVSLDWYYVFIYTHLLFFFLSSMTNAAGFVADSYSAAGKLSCVSMFNVWVTCWMASKNHGVGAVISSLSISNPQQVEEQWIIKMPGGKC